MMTETREIGNLSALNLLFFSLPLNEQKKIVKWIKHQNKCNRIGCNNPPTHLLLIEDIITHKLSFVAVCNEHRRKVDYDGFETEIDIIIKEDRKV